MIKIHNLPRRSGKTTAFIESLRQDPEAIGISTLSKSVFHRIYPEDLLSRIYTPDDILSGRINGVRKSKQRKIKIDEGLNKAELMSLVFYELGSGGWNVEVWGSYLPEVKL